MHINYTPAAKIKMSLIVLIGLLTSLPLSADSYPGTRYANDSRNLNSQHRHRFGSAPTVETVAQGRARPTDDPVLGEFKTWVTNYIRSGPARLSEQRGEDLAKRRRKALRSLIQVNPARAIDFAVLTSSREKLPSRVMRHLEEEVSGFGDLLLLIAEIPDPATGKVTRSETERVVILGGKTYQAFVYGRREAMTSKVNIPIRGIVIDGVMAVHESPVKILQPEPNEAGLLGLNNGGLDVEVGGTVRHFSDREQLQRFTSDLIKKEMRRDPGIKPIARGLADSSATCTVANPPVSDSWTTGLKKILFIRVDFPDLPGELLTSEQAQSLIDIDAAQFYERNSYNKTTLCATVTPLLTLPRPTSYYVGDAEDAVGLVKLRLLNDARPAALAAGFDTANYDLDIVAVKQLPIGPSGIATIGGKGVLLNGTFSVGTTVHELGHNYGLPHANLWLTSDGTTLGYGITSRFNKSAEYGDAFDEMGGDEYESWLLGRVNDFNSWFKYRLNWLSDSDVARVTSTGIYRIHAIDDLDSVGKRALKIPSVNGANYWVEFRRNGNVFTQNGAIIRWVYDVGGPFDFNFRESDLLDMSPGDGALRGVRGGARNSPLVVNQVFTDLASGLTIKTLRKTGSIEHPVLEVEVTLSKFILNGLVVDHSGFPVRDGASIALSGSRTARVPVRWSGVYSVAVQPGDSYTITPSKEGYSFSPSSRRLDDMGAPHTLNFEALKHFKISGRVRDIENATGVSGVQVNLRGCGSARVVTGPNGDYSFPAAIEGRNCVLTAHKAGYLIGPSSIRFAEMASDQEARFCATTLQITAEMRDDLCNITMTSVSGRVSDNMGSGLAGVTVSATGTTSVQATTNANGEYTLRGLVATGDYVVRPSRDFYSFSPNNFSGTLPATLNFTGYPVMVVIRGKITDVNNQGINAVTVTLSGSLSAMTTTNAAGDYAFGVQAGGTYTITPSSNNYTFTPPHQTFNILNANQPGVNFTGASGP